MHIQLYALVLGSSSGPAGGCTLGDFTMPANGRKSTEIATLTCIEQSCVLSSSVPFRGFAVSSKTSKLQSEASNSELTLDGHCLSHTNNDLKSSVRFTTSKDTSVLYATVVYEHAVSGHLYGLASTLVNPGIFYVVGGGPGGLGAARRLAELNATVILYEAGTKTPVNFNAPIMHSYQSNAPETAIMNVLGERLGKGLGGTQNINGAVFAPGTPEDLAMSLGVSVGLAEHAQKIATGYVPHDSGYHDAPPVGMMWKCINTSKCDEGSSVSANVLMARRSIAYDAIPENIQVVENCVVESVSNTQITVSAQSKSAECADVALTPSKSVIVAAGALTSPRLLGATTITNWNHYYTLALNFLSANPGNVNYGKQKFLYETHGSNMYEINKATLVLPEGQLGPGTPMGVYEIIVNMSMYPTARETHKFPDKTTLSTDYAKQGFPDATATNPPVQSWHYAGSVSHTMFRVDGKSNPNIYIGDASALMKPFNCHTSMPAVAAGVLAAETAMGMHSGSPKTQLLADTAPIMFVTGAWVLLIGILLHQFADTKKLHYYVMPLGIVIIVYGVIVAHTSDVRLKEDTMHATSAYVVLGFMGIQMVTGPMLRSFEIRPQWIRLFHRGLGVLALLGLNLLYLDATINDTDLRAHTDDVNAYKITAGVYVVLSAAVSVKTIHSMVTIFSTALNDSLFKQLL